MVDNIEAKVYERLRAGESIESIANSFTSAMNKANVRYKEELKVEADRQIQVNRLLDLLNNMRDYVCDYAPVDVSDLLTDEPITRDVAEQFIDVFDSVIEQVASQMREFTTTLANATHSPTSAAIAREKSIIKPRKTTLTPEERIEDWLRRNNL